MKIDLTKNYTISGVGLAMLCQLIDYEDSEDAEETLAKCVREV